MAPGEVTFYHGKVCPKHPELEGQRYFSTYQCAACRLEATKDYYRRNASVIKAKKNAEYRQKTGEAARAEALLRQGVQQAPGAGG